MVYRPKKNIQVKIYARVTWTFLLPQERGEDGKRNYDFRIGDWIPISCYFLFQGQGSVRASENAIKLRYSQPKLSSLYGCLKIFQRNQLGDKISGMANTNLGGDIANVRLCRVWKRK